MPGRYIGISRADGDAIHQIAAEPHRCRVGAERGATVGRDGQPAGGGGTDGVAVDCHSIHRVAAQAVCGRAVAEADAIIDRDAQAAAGGSVDLAVDHGDAVHHCAAQPVGGSPVGERRAEIARDAQPIHRRGIDRAVGDNHATHPIVTQPAAGGAIAECRAADRGSQDAQAAVGSGEDDPIMREDIVDAVAPQAVRSGPGAEPPAAVGRDAQPAGGCRVDGAAAGVDAEDAIAPQPLGGRLVAEPPAAVGRDAQPVGRRGEDAAATDGHVVHLVVSEADGAGSEARAAELWLRMGRRRRLGDAADEQEREDDGVSGGCDRHATLLTGVSCQFGGFAYGMTGTLHGYAPAMPAVRAPDASDP